MRNLDRRIKLLWKQDKQRNQMEESNLLQYSAKIVLNKLDLYPHSIRVPTTIYKTSAFKKMDKNN